jgi:hypothetical protein
MGTLTSLTLPLPEAIPFSSGLLGDCEQMLLAKYGPAFAISLDCEGSSWLWSIWEPNGGLQARAARLSESRADAIDYLESFLRRSDGR